jgi:hypothetical protein
MFLKRHVFVNACEASNIEPSGTVTSATNCAQSLHVCAADALVGNAAAGIKDSTNATSINVDTACILAFIGSSSSLQIINTFK